MSSDPANHSIQITYVFLAGAAALTAIVPNISCDHQCRFIHDVQSILTELYFNSATTCSSTRARLAFSWIITMTRTCHIS